MSVLINSLLIITSCLNAVPSHFQAVGFTLSTTEMNTRDTTSSMLLLTSLSSDKSGSTTEEPTKPTSEMSTATSFETTSSMASLFHTELTTTDLSTTPTPPATTTMVPLTTTIFSTTLSLTTKESPTTTSLSTMPTTTSSITTSTNTPSATTPTIPPSTTTPITTPSTSTTTTTPSITTPTTTSSTTTSTTTTSTTTSTTTPSTTSKQVISSSATKTTSHSSTTTTKPDNPIAGIIGSTSASLAVSAALIVTVFILYWWRNKKGQKPVAKPPKNENLLNSTSKTFDDIAYEDTSISREKPLYENGKKRVETLKGPGMNIIAILGKEEENAQSSVYEITEKLTPNHSSTETTPCDVTVSINENDTQDDQRKMNTEPKKYAPLKPPVKNKPQKPNNPQILPLWKNEQLRPNEIKQLQSTEKNIDHKDGMIQPNVEKKLHKYPVLKPPQKNPNQKNMQSKQISETNPKMVDQHPCENRAELQRPLKTPIQKQSPKPNTQSSVYEILQPSQKKPTKVYENIPLKDQSENSKKIYENVKQREINSGDYTHLLTNNEKPTDDSTYTTLKIKTKPQIKKKPGKRT